MVLFLDLGTAASVVPIVVGVVGVVGSGVAIVRRVRRRHHISEPEDVRQPRLPAHFRRKLGPQEFEVIPTSFHVWLDRDVPEIEIQLLGINYMKKPLTSVRVIVRNIRPDGKFQVLQVESGDQGEIPPQNSRDLWCRRSLTDAEVRTIEGSPRGRYLSGSVMFTARAFKGRNEVRCDPFHPQVVTGTIDQWQDT